MSSSHLAYALFFLPHTRRDDALAFYRFCREIDDLADETGRPEAERAGELDRWLERIPDHLPPSLERLVDLYGVDPMLLSEIVKGCASDLGGQVIETWADLEAYCWRVACAVGLVSIRIFGAQEPASDAYAEALGHALQLTNILRDVGEDARMGRVYLPRELLSRHGVSRSDILQDRDSVGLQAACAEVAQRARAAFATATPPLRDRRCLLAPRIMKALYQTILQRLERRGFPVWGRPIRLGSAERLVIALGVVVGGRA